MPQTISDTSSAFSRSAVAATLPYLIRQIRDNVSDQTPLTSYLMGKLGTQARAYPGGVASDNMGDGLPGVIMGGRDIHVPVQLIDNQTVGSYAGADPLDITNQDTDNYALFPIRQIAGSLVIVGRDLRGCKGEAQIYNLLQAKTNRLMNDLRVECNRQFVSDGTGNGGKDVLGLAAIVGTGTLGGISPTTFPKWQPGGFPVGNARTAFITAALAFSSGGLAAMRGMVPLVTFGTDGPDAIFCSRTTWSSYAAAIEGNVRYTQIESGDASFKVLAFQGIPVYFDHAFPDAAASRIMYFLNSRHLAFQRESSGDFQWIDDGQRPANQDVFTKIMIVEGNVVTDNRRTLGVLQTIT